MVVQNCNFRKKLEKEKVDKKIKKYENLRHILNINKKKSLANTI